MGATSAFGGGGGFGQAPSAQGPPPSVGAQNYTSIMARPSEGILAQAAAAAPVEEKKGFFKTYWPLIAGLSVLVIALVVIIIIFSKKN